MAKIFIEESSLIAIGDAIREKTGKTELLSPAQMATEISGITGGGGSTDVTVWTVTFIGADGTTLYEKPCIDGDDCYNPITTGKIEEPTKEATPQYTYTYTGWGLEQDGTASSTALTKVTADRSVYAAFAANIRYYTVNFYDGDTLLKTETIAYGETATPPDTIKEGYKLVGWGTEDFIITQDTDFYAEWIVDEGWLVMLERPELPTYDVGDNDNVVYSADGKILFLTNGNYIVRYDTTTTPYTKLGISNWSHDIYDMSVSNGETQYLAFTKKYSSSKDGLTYYAGAYKLKEDGSTTGNSLIPSVSGEYGAFGSTFSNDGTLFAVRGRSKVYIFNTTILEGSTKWTLVATLDLTAAGTYNTYKAPLAFSPDGTKLIVGIWNRSLSGYKNYQVFENVDGTWTDMTTTYLTFNRYYPRSIKYSPDGRYLAIATIDEQSTTNKIYELAVFDTTTTPYTKVFSTLDSKICIYDVAFSPDSSLLVGVGNFVNDELSVKYIIAFETGTWKQKQSPMVTPTIRAYDVNFSPDGKTLALAGYTPELLTLYEIRE